MQFFNNFLQKMAFHLFLKSKFSSRAYPVFLELLNASKQTLVMSPINADFTSS